MKTFYVGVKSAILNDKNELLLLKSPKGYWELPGGRINENEDINQALERELKEELPNIKNIVCEGIIHAVKMPFNLKDGQGLILIVYKVKADFEGDIKISEEHSSFRWFSLQESAEKLEAEMRSIPQKL